MTRCIVNGRCGAARGRVASAFHSNLYFGVGARIGSCWPQKLRLSSACANRAPTFGSLPAESKRQPVERAGERRAFGSVRRRGRTSRTIAAADRRSRARSRDNGGRALARCRTRRSTAGRICSPAAHRRTAAQPARARPRPRRSRAFSIGEAARSRCPAGRFRPADRVTRRPARRAPECPCGRRPSTCAADGVARRHVGRFGDGERESRERPLDLDPLRLMSRRDGADRRRRLEESARRQSTAPKVRPDTRASAQMWQAVRRARNAGPDAWPISPAGRRCLEAQFSPRSRCHSVAVERCLAPEKFFGELTMGYKVAVVGATGNVGREMLAILAERNFPPTKWWRSPRARAWARSARSATRR